MPAERIELAGTATVEVATLGSAIAATEPRYSFFRYAHAVAGEARAPLVFVYTCPTAAPVKARMLYASSKAGVLAAAEKEAGVVVAKKVRACFLVLSVRSCGGAMETSGEGIGGAEEDRADG